MATMIPDDIDEFKTEGERRFYRFLEAAAKPDQKYTTWYLPDIEGKEPDFILFCEDMGLIIFEVKDWTLEQIKEANPRNFILKIGREQRSLKNPLQQARDYFESLFDKIRADGRLLSRDQEHYGKPKVPIDYGVVFPNISRDSYLQSGLNKIINPKRVFFGDDMQSTSTICTDSSGDCFKKTLMEMFPVRFRFKITPADYINLKELMFPVVRINRPQRDTCIYIDASQRRNVLDDRQEAIARRTSGRQIISGPSGSGKTLILAHKAVFLKQYTRVKRILFVCFNVTLVNYIKRLLTEKGVGLGPEGVEVYHFFELCSKILGEEVQYEKENGEYYKMVAEEALAGLRDGGMRYEAVLVDEGQNFTDEMFAVIEALLHEERQKLAVALDEEQNIYQCGLGWKERLLREGARLDELSAIYRNTAQIRQFALGFMGTAPGREVHATYCETRGPKPELKQVDDLEQVFSYVADKVRTLHDRREYPLSEMAVLYTMRHFSEEGGIFEANRPIPEQLAAALESRGIMYDWLAEDYRSKRFYDITTDRVSISTIPSVHGLDYACVFLMGLDQLQWTEGSREKVRKLVYAGITRARHRLVIPYVRKTPLIEALSIAGVRS
jgi:hypothetical protein